MDFQIVGIIILTFSGFVNLSDVASSTFELKNLLLAEIQLIKHLDNSRGQNEARDRYRETVYPPDHAVRKINHHNDSMVADFVANPLNILGLLRRTAIEFQQWNESWQKNMTEYGEFPPEGDYHEACGSLILLHETYNLNATLLRKGIVSSDILDGTGRRHREMGSGYIPDWKDLFHIGESACNSPLGNLLDTCLEWVGLSLKQCPDKVMEMDFFLGFF